VKKSDRGKTSASFPRKKAVESIRKKGREGRRRLWISCQLSFPDWGPEAKKRALHEERGEIPLAGGRKIKHQGC